MALKDKVSANKSNKWLQNISFINSSKKKNSIIIMYRKHFINGELWGQV